MSPRAGGGAFFSRAAAQKLALAAGRAGAAGARCVGDEGRRLARGARSPRSVCGAGRAAGRECRARGSLPRLTEGAAMLACEVSRLGEGAA